MKTIKSIVLVALIAFSSVVSANTNPENPVKTTKAESNVITQQVEKLLQDPTFEIEKDIIASVTLTINKKNEIVVLSVDTDDYIVEEYIKSRLNYKKLSENTLNKGK